ncbi:hypothetical protein Ctob_015451, partial [Chrysochromulina tobinii]
AIFSFGCALVIAAIFLYGSSAQTPQELCESLGGTWPCAVPKANRDYKELLLRSPRDLLSFVQLLSLIPSRDDLAKHEISRISAVVHEA